MYYASCLKSNYINMKKIIISLSVLILSFLLVPNTFADNTQNKIKKQIAITNSKVEDDYGKELSYKVDQYFLWIKYYNKVEELNKLEDSLEKAILKYKEKSYLNINDRKKYNLLQNMYYRAKVLSIYYTK